MLDGLPVAWHERGLVQAAIEAELTRLLAEPAMTMTWQGLTTQQDGHMPLLSGAPLNITAGQSAAEMGGGIAQAVLGGLNP